jgi:hypothetical protein
VSGKASPPLYELGPKFVTASLPLNRRAALSYALTNQTVMKVRRVDEIKMSKQSAVNAIVVPCSFNFAVEKSKIDVPACKFQLRDVSQ